MEKQLVSVHRLPAVPYEAVSNWAISPVSLVLEFSSRVLARNSAPIGKSESQRLQPDSVLVLLRHA